MNFQNGANSGALPARLRLSGLDGIAVDTDELRSARRAVAMENHAARVPGPDDARWVLADLAERSIEGGRAAIIRPEVRRKLMTRAVKVGLRPFDANLVIAIVQDAARRGECLTGERLAMVGGEGGRDRVASLALLGAAVALGAGMLIGAIALIA